MTSESKPPIAAAWLYMCDGYPDYQTIPASWQAIDFTKVDLLLIGPLGLQSDGAFDLFTSEKTGSLATLFQWVVQTARKQNSSIKIIVSQWWGTVENTEHVWGYALNKLGDGDQAIENYAESTKEFLKKWNLDGYDIDYEDTNVIANAPKILATIRAKLDELAKERKGRRYYVTVSPSELEHLRDARRSLDYVNMQTYSGGIGLTVKDFTDLGLDRQRLLYGICPEQPDQSHSIEEVEKAYTDDGLAGIHLWRLNSSNYKDELAVQDKVYTFLHPK